MLQGCAQTRRIEQTLTAPPSPPERAILPWAPPSSLPPSIAPAVLLPCCLDDWGEVGGCGAPAMGVYQNSLSRFDLLCAHTSNPSPNPYPCCAHSSKEAAEQLRQMLVPSALGAIGGVPSLENNISAKGGTLFESFRAPEPAATGATPTERSRTPTERSSSSLLVPVEGGPDVAPVPPPALEPVELVEALPGLGGSFWGLDWGMNSQRARTAPAEEKKLNLSNPNEACPASPRTPPPTYSASGSDGLFSKGLDSGDGGGSDQYPSDEDDSNNGTPHQLFAFLDGEKHVLSPNGRLTESQRNMVAINVPVGAARKNSLQKYQLEYGALGY